MLLLLLSPVSPVSLQSWLVLVVPCLCVEAKASVPAAKTNLACLKPRLLCGPSLVPFP